MSRVEEIQKQIEELKKKTQELQKELEIEKQKTEIECPFEEREQYFVLCNDGRVASDCWEDYDCELAQWSQGNILKLKNKQNVNVIDATYSNVLDSLKISVMVIGSQIGKINLKINFVFCLIMSQVN